MSWRAALLAALGMVAAGALVFALFQRQLSGTAFAFGSHPEVIEALERSLEDQKRLARLDAEATAEYQARFAEVERTLTRLRILELNRESLERRYEAILLAVFLAATAAAAAVFLIRQSREVPRLARLREALTRLASGEAGVVAGLSGRDLIGRIGAMVEQASRRMARDRRRLQALEQLSAWQETARRHVHELRTPLTAADLELRRARSALTGSGDVLGTARAAVLSAAEELARLQERIGRFTSFARLPAPRRERSDLGALLADIVGTYRSAWPNLRLELDAPLGIEAEVDADLLRQVIVNLCDNSSFAAAEDVGTVSLRLHRTETGIALDVADDGPGVPEALRERVFEPYVSGRGAGGGTGLGLAICRKILLDHGGDLELAATSAAGSVFRLTLPALTPDRTETRP